MSPFRTAVGAVIGLAAATLLGWAFGLDWAQALLVGLTLVALFGVRQLPSTNPGEVWPTPPDTGSDQGVRREVARLSWSLHGHESRVERVSLLRLRALADHRLRRYGLRLDEPADAVACGALLGPAHATLTAGPRAHVTFEQFSRSLTALEKLDEKPTEGSRRG